ncbi:MAG: dockerin type I domain-containing protein [Bacteroidetes bacterium]|nr:dockerin type I domain-containing protein [Bacteroidota bacterium]
MKYFILFVTVFIMLIFSTLAQPLKGQNSVKGQAEQVSTLQRTQRPSEGITSSTIGTSDKKAKIKPAKFPTDIAYGFNNYDPGFNVPLGPVKFILQDPDSIISLAPAGISNSCSAGCWANGLWYVSEDILPNNSNLWTINPVSGAMTLIGSMGCLVSGLTFDNTFHMMYAISHTNLTRLYTINTTTGISAQIGICGNYSGASLGCDQNGQLYMIDVATNNLLAVNKLNANVTVTGPTGFIANGSQDMEFDYSDSTMYLAAYNATTGGELRTVNLATGATTLVGAFKDSMEVSGFAIENPGSVTYPDDMGIISLTSPVSGVQLGSNEVISVIIRNFGSSPQSGVPVYYVLDGGTPVVDILAGPINPGWSIPFTFMVYGDFSAYCTHTLMVCTALPGDSNTNNDCKTYTFTHFIPTFSDTIWPASLPTWTGSTDSSIFTQNSLINSISGGIEAGWAKFDLSNIPNNIPISSAQLRYYVNNEYGTSTLKINRITGDPQTGNPATIYNQIASGTNYITSANSTTPGWHTLNLPNNAKTDLTIALLQDWFALGFYDSDTCAGCSSFSIDGWSEPNKPYIVVSNTTTLCYDIAVNSLDVDTTVYITGSYIPKATVKNLGANTGTFTVAMTGTGGYSSIKNVNSLNPGDSVQLMFDPWNIPDSLVCLSVQSNLLNDQDLTNNHINWCWNNVIPPTVSGVVSYKNAGSTLIRDSTTVLLVPVNPSGWVRIDTVDSNGNYSFTNVLPGLYYLMVTTEKVWGGGNSTDALLVLKHFVGMQPLTGLKLAAADANSDGIVNSVDALMIVERFIWAISVFPGSDWVSEQPLVIIPATTFAPVDIKVLCRGDVNGSYIP